MTSACRLNDVSCRIGNKQILDHISLEIPRGDIIGILGPNGAGKTTLLSLMTGLRRHSAGEITVLGARLPVKGGSLRRRIGVVLQDTALYEELTTFENLRFSASLYDVANARRRIGEVLELLMLSDRSNQIVRTLSGGLRRRIAIARALLHDPELLIIDEPTLGVDVEARHAIWSHLRVLRAKGRTVVVATNYLDETQALCDTVAVLRAGELLAVESPEALVTRTGNCLDVECGEQAGRSIAEALGSLAGISRIDQVPSGLSVFLHGETMPREMMNVILGIADIEGFRVRPPDLAEVFRTLEDSL
jgi:ABC-2 type transport system ATP-binding protein